MIRGRIPGRLYRTVRLWGLIAASVLFSQAAQAQVTACEALGRGTKIGIATIVYAASVPAGNFPLADGHALTDLPPFCRVVATAAPSPQSNIAIEIWLPAGAAWNGKLMGLGNGGFAGAIVYPALAGGLRRGYAVANTDMGTYPAGLHGALFALGYDAGNGRPEVVKDWGYRATHEMTLLGKAVVQRYYGRPQQHAYFVGCSTGGHQGLTEAQRFPEDYDAIIAGAPGHNRTHLHAMFTALSMIPATPGLEAPTRQSLSLWSQAVAKACVGKDGGVPGDPFLTNPGACALQPRTLLCAPGQQPGTCLPKAQADTIAHILDGVRNPRTSKTIYPGPAISVEPVGKGLPPLDKVTAYADLARWVFGPDWNAATFDFDKDMGRVDDALAATVNANDPDLGAFAAHGGKLILFHGWDDTVVSPYDSILYYDRAFARGRKKEDFLRLFMVPGMSHCAGGAGFTRFGQKPEDRPSDAGDELIAALEHWAEQGKAPERLTAYKGDGASGPNRPLCAYPNTATYKGAGSPDDAASFECRPAAPPKFARPAPEYLR